MYIMHLLPSVTIQPNLELKTQPKQLLGSLPLVIALLECSDELKQLLESESYHLLHEPSGQNSEASLLNKAQA